MHDLQHDVIAELEWDPVVHDAGVSAAVDNGVVTLRGGVSNDIERRAAECAVLRVRGVKAVINQIEVTPRVRGAVADNSLAQAIATCFAQHVLLPSHGVCVRVTDGWVTLTGEVTWHYQRLEAEQAVRRLRGVAGVENLITIVPATHLPDVSRQIEAALQRSAGLDAQWITVEAYKGKVVLRGSVRSWLERQQAAFVAWRAPGVVEVINQLAVTS